LIIPGGAVFLDNRCFLWDVDPVLVDQKTGRGIWEGWGVERFKIFEVVVPRPGENKAKKSFPPHCDLFQTTKGGFETDSGMIILTLEFLSEILLLGTGLTVIPPPPSIRQYISSLGIQLDVMDSVRSPFPLVRYLPTGILT
jgi:NADH dehydrogenase [ubiquinone] 1 alpha subcomplex assembly factor 3